MKYYFIAPKVAQQHNRMQPLSALSHSMPPPASTPTIGPVWNGWTAISSAPLPAGRLQIIDDEHLTFRHNGFNRRLTNVHGKVIHQLLA